MAYGAEILLSLFLGLFGITLGVIVSLGVQFILWAALATFMIWRDDARTVQD